MLYGKLNEQGNHLDVRDGISEITILHIFTYKSLASGALILGIIVIADCPWTCVSDVLNNTFITYFLYAYNT